MEQPLQTRFYENNFPRQKRIADLSILWLLLEPILKQMNTNKYPQRSTSFDYCTNYMLKLRIFFRTTFFDIHIRSFRTNVFFYLF